MRSSGILLHITSLPSCSGVGTLGDVDRFVEFLQQSGQKYWQLLPITPTDFVNSPYASPSAFAGNTLLVDLDQLAKDGLICDETLSASKTCKGNDYVFAKYHNNIALREAYSNFVRFNPPADYEDFCRANSYWLDDYALFCALKSHFGGKSWLDWEDDDIRMRRPAALAAYVDKLSDEVDFYVFCQYVFDKQWADFRVKLAKADIKLVGDIPIYVSYDSADVWAHSQLFDLTNDRRPKWVAGVPPDYFSADGQLWGNPLYDWDAMKKDGYDWWLKRVQRCAQLFDVLRIDHFRAFDSYYAIAYGEKTARNGHWRKGVGYEFVKKLQDSVDITIVAEDLGDIPQSVLDLRDKCGLAGMKVVQFAFDGNPKNAFLPVNFVPHCVAYLGTHDNDTTQGWWNALTKQEQQRVLDTLGIAESKHMPRTLIQILANSNAELVVYSMQDVAEDDTAARMNTPGTLGCWKYMAQRGDFCAANAKWLKKITAAAGR